MIKKQCIICGKPLNNGIIINGRGICRCCETRMISTEIDTDFYNYYINCLRRTIVQNLLKGEDLRCHSYHL